MTGRSKQRETCKFSSCFLTHTILMTDLWLCLPISPLAAVISVPRGIRNDSVLTEIDSDVSSFTPPPSATWEKEERKSSYLWKSHALTQRLLCPSGFFFRGRLLHLFEQVMHSPYGWWWCQNPWGILAQSQSQNMHASTKWKEKLFNLFIIDISC